MKTKMITLTLLLFSISSAFAAQSFTGTSSAFGDISRQCDDIIDPPSEEEAKENADALASNFCDTFSLTHVRVSKFKITEGCVKEGKGFAVVKRQFKNATAFYRCQ